MLGICCSFNYSVYDDYRLFYGAIPGFKKPKHKVKFKVKMSCQHLEFSRKDYQLRCTLAIVTFWDGAASQGIN
jgi:hypothetical protein